VGAARFQGARGGLLVGCWEVAQGVAQEVGWELAQGVVGSDTTMVAFLLLW
jgi:hypothetical protein